MKAREVIVKFPGTEDFLHLHLDEEPSKFAGFVPTLLYALTYVESSVDPEGGEPLLLATQTEYFLEHEYILATCALNVRMLSDTPWKASPFQRPLHDFLVKSNGQHH